MPMFECPAGQIPELPDRVSHDEDGFLYICEFSNGTVKVGRTQRPARRVAHHNNDARKFGGSLSRIWLSTETRAVVRAEMELIAAANRAGVLLGGNEYFTDCRIEDLLEELGDLHLTPSSHAEIESYQAVADARLEQFKAWMSSSSQPPGAVVRVSPTWAALIALLFPPSEDYRLPGPVKTGTRAEILETAALLADGPDHLSIGEALDYSWIDVIERAMTAALKNGIVQIRLAALLANRRDLLDSGWAQLEQIDEQVT